ncbi:uncharacterized protein TRIVIDRAFT_203361 [Trichoderma virens Gv29-8]|uniref:Uncharacterized protein n=1 Tax=Hypocrea virens (strain Gv29-8 / FGSC 10586) TaxID=413071 RepID=G9N093_HYPVG|nr:uncharacterized protein TRIVIDRAFT_203361 [Trichoderma virens Gv29-8]EHK19775.1 hypothetical protein TRIVIDRAFT_203361 [Trichoderma virens Gv29-8]UKZ53165.1 hypothetical protein TrVGV298_006957 [Trichoderma virens]
MERIQIRMPQNGEPALWVAVQQNRTDICRLLLAHNADPDLKDFVIEQSTPLLCATMNSNMDLVKLLVDNGADVNKSVGRKYTPVYGATHSQNTEIVQYLLSHNANPTLACSLGSTPMHVAAYQGSSEIVRLLAEAKADIDYCENSALMSAIHIMSDSAEVLRILLEYGADINRKDSAGRTALDAAIVNNHPNIVKLMLSESKVKPDFSRERLLEAVRNGYTEVVSLVLESGADVNMLDEGNASLTALAMPLKDASMIRTVLEYGPDLSIIDKRGNTALHRITANTPVESVRRVVNAGGQLHVGSLNNEYETPLIISIRACNMEVFSYLMTKSLVSDTLNIAYSPREDMVQILIKNGADTNHVCPSAYGTPLITALQRRGKNIDKLVEKIVKLLLEHGAVPNRFAGFLGFPIIAASIACSPSVIQLLLSQKVSVDVTDAFGRKPAHFACYNSLEALNILGVPDSDFAVRDIVGRVPLHYAVLRGQLDLVEEVLARSMRVGVGIDVLDYDGWTPLLWAARASRIFSCEEELQRPQYDAVVSLLLSKGADPNVRGDGQCRNWSVSEVAYYHGADSARIAPKDRFESAGFEWNSIVEMPGSTRLKSAQSPDGEDLLNEKANERIHSDDEVIEEEDLVL